MTPLVSNIIVRSVWVGAASVFAVTGHLAAAIVCIVVGAFVEDARGAP